MTDAPFPFTLIHGDGKPGPLFAGRKVAQVISHRLCEDGATLLVIAVLRDGTTAAITVCPNEPITATEIEVESI